MAHLFKRARRPFFFFAMLKRKKGGGRAKAIYRINGTLTNVFEDEYIRLLDRHEVDYDPQYVWD